MSRYFLTEAERSAIAERVASFDTPDRRNAYRSRQFPRADRVKDLDKRYRWDLAYVADIRDVITAVYDRGGNDAHIDTALRMIVSPL